MGIIAEAVKSIFCPSRCLTDEERKRAHMMILGAGAGGACGVEDGVIKVRDANEDIDDESAE